MTHHIDVKIRRKKKVNKKFLKKYNNKCIDIIIEEKKIGSGAILIDHFLRLVLTF